MYKDKRRSRKFQNLMHKYIYELGPSWKIEGLAKACGVKQKTANRWTYGYKPSFVVWWNIAKYIASHHRILTSRQVYLTIENSFKD